MTQEKTSGLPISPLRREAVRLQPTPAVRMEPLSSGQSLPLVARRGSPAVDLADWATENRTVIQAALAERGALLFRDFPVKDLAGFQSVVAAISPDLLEYRYRSTPRTEIGSRIYTSTEYPAHLEIPLHNENSYARSWPRKIFFFCEKAAIEGGMTPIADSHDVFRRIPGEIRDRFIARKVMYVRNYGGGADLPWQEVFQTENPAEVEELCRGMNIELEWRGEGQLRTRQICQAAARHPESGKPLWFNQAHLFHISAHEPEVRDALLEVFSEEDLPRNSFYGDGTPIEPADLDEIRRAYREAQVMFPWNAGDVLLLDNMAIAHGRTPYRGERKIRVGMAEPIDSAQVSI